MNRAAGRLEKAQQFVAEMPVGLHFFSLGCATPELLPFTEQGFELLPQEQIFMVIHARLVWYLGTVFSPEQIHADQVRSSQRRRSDNSV